MEVLAVQRGVMTCQRAKTWIWNVSGRKNSNSVMFIGIESNVVFPEDLGFFLGGGMVDDRASVCLAS